MLQGDGLSVSFGGFQALRSVSLDLATGCTHALIGPNGAGKSTLFNAITGHLRPQAGAVTLAGADVTGLAPHLIVRRGLARSFQRANIFQRLTVAQNLEVAVLARARRHFVLHGAMDDVGKEVATLEELVGLEGERDRVAGQLSYGLQKQLELAIALAAGPRLLVLDEPTAGMSPRETEATMRLLVRIKEQRGLTLLFSEHDMAVVFGMADTVFVLHHGEVIAAGPPAQVRADDRVRRVYLGEAGDA